MRKDVEFKDSTGLASRGWHSLCERTAESLREGGHFEAYIKHFEIVGGGARNGLVQHLHLAQA